LPVARESDENVHLERQSAAVLFQGIAIIVPLISMADFFQVPRQLLFWRCPTVLISCVVNEPAKPSCSPRCCCGCGPICSLIPASSHWTSTTGRKNSGTHQNAGGKGRACRASQSVVGSSRGGGRPNGNAWLVMDFDGVLSQITDDPDASELLPGSVASLWAGKFLRLIH
jgi:hypothetical protein